MLHCKHACPSVCCVLVLSDVDEVESAELANFHQCFVCGVVGDCDADIRHVLTAEQRDAHIERPNHRDDRHCPPTLTLEATQQHERRMEEVERWDVGKEEAQCVAAAVGSSLL